MCNYCDEILFVERFRTPKEYDNTVEYLQKLVNGKGFLLVDCNCPLGGHKKDGYWVEDIIYHVLECPKCGQVFTCAVNTYRGGGSFHKGR